jgi:hypothetical protein
MTTIKTSPALKESEIRDFFEYYAIPQSDRTLSAFRDCCAYWNLTGADLDRAMRMAGRYHRTALPSVRRILGIYLREWIAPFDRGFSRRVYYNVPGTITFMYLLRRYLEPEHRESRFENKEDCSVYAGSPDFISMVVLYGLFGRKTRIETGNCRHCAVNLMRAALMEDPAYPPADLQISFGFTCDEATRQDAMTKAAGEDLLRIFVMNPVRSEKSPAYIEQVLRRALSEIQSKFGLPAMQPAEMTEIYRVYKSARFRLAVKVHQIIDHVSRCGKFRITNNDIVFLESLLITSFQCGMEYIEETLSALLKEIKEDTAADVRAVRNRFCVYYTPICNPDYGEVMEENGIALLDHTAFSNNALVTGIRDPCKDASLEAMGMLIAGQAVKEGEKIADLILRKKLDGFVSGMFAFDRWMGMQQHQLQSIIEEKTGKTVFIYDTDFWNQESFAKDRMENAVETLRYTMEVRN